MKCIDEEIPFEIPSSWCWVRVMNLSEVVRGGSPRPAGSKEFYDGTIPFLKVADLTKDNNMYVNTYSSTIKEAGLKKTRLVKANTLLLSNSGATLGVPKICSFDTTFNDGIAAFLYLSDELKPYMYWFFCAYTDIFRTYNQGTAQPNLNTDIIKSTLVSIPPIKEQQKIVSKLEWLLLLIAKYDKAQQELDQINVDIFSLIKKSLLQEAIKGHLVEQDPKEEAASKLLERIRLEKRKLVKIGNLKVKDKTDSIIFKSDDNKYYEKSGNQIICIDDEIVFDVPKGWELSRLGNIAMIYTGNSISENEKKTYYTNVQGREYIGTKDVGFDCVVKYNNGVAIPQKHEGGFKIAPANSVLMCIEGGSAGRKIAIIDRDICFGNKLCCFAPYIDISKYIFYYLQSPSFFELFTSGKTGIIGGVSVNTIKNLIIPIPPLQEIQRIISKIELLLASIMSR